MWDLLLQMLSDLGCRFQQRPHRTLIALSWPVMGSLIAEPLAALTDTMFIERLGATAASGLGAATIVLFSTTWVFNFLNLGTQTEVARAVGAGDLAMAALWARKATGLALVLGTFLTAVLLLGMEPTLRFMSDHPAVRTQARDYLEVRAFGAPAMLLTFAACGALRGLSRMRLTLWITALTALINVVLDPVLIFGLGPIPALGMRGAAIATVAGQGAGSLVAILVLFRELPGIRQPEGSELAPATRPRALQLLHIGGDMVLRTSALLLFILLATRAALQEGPAAGAAHQGVRQVWMFLAFLLDAFAASSQSLVAYFLGAGQQEHARRVAAVACRWALGSGLVLTVVLLPSESLLEPWLAPPEARAAFSDIWWICALAQPVNALSFVTDGLHWGASEYRYLRNAMLVSSALGITGLMLVPSHTPATLSHIWWMTTCFLGCRAVLGVLRIYPGFGKVWSQGRVEVGKEEAPSAPPPSLAA